jgi:hypothetical protein
VPVTIAPSRKATDRQVAGRHIGTPVLAWEAENRASFILDKIAEGYGNDELADDLGFSMADIQNARQVRAIADMARALPLDEDVKAKLDNPRAKVFTTLNRVFNSSVGREYLKVEKTPIMDCWEEQPKANSSAASRSSLQTSPRVRRHPDIK